MSDQIKHPARDNTQAMQIRDQMWSDLKAALPDLDRLSQNILKRAHRAQKLGTRKMTLELDVADWALIAQVLCMAQGELHLHEEGLVV